MVQQLVGKKIVAIKGHISQFDRRKKPANQRVLAEYILFDDGETYIQLDEQDYYVYHDCSREAKELFIMEDKVQWQWIKETLPDATEDL